MPYRCLADFLEELSHADELTRVEDEVDPAWDVARIATQAAQSGGSALLFGMVKGHNPPVLCNLLATERRICRALGAATLAEAAGQIDRLLNVSSPESWIERLKGGAQSAALSSVAPREVRAAACQQIVRLHSDIDLDELPLLQVEPCASMPHLASAGTADTNAATGPPCRRPLNVPDQTSPTAFPRAIHAAVVLAADPDSHRPAAERFDLQQLDATRLAVCWAAHDDHARLLGEYRARNQEMPLAVVIGGDPAFWLAAAAPLPPGSDVCAVAGLLRGKPLDVVACRGVDLMAPAEAEIVLEGFVDPSAPPVMAGPFCGPTGHVVPPRPAVVMQVTALAHRANPIYAAMVPGGELTTIARAMQRVFLPLTRLAMPELVDYDMPAFAAARHWAAVSIRKTYAGQGRRAAHAAWLLRPMMFAKMLIVVDADVDPADQQAVSAAVAVNVRPDRDVFFEPGPADPFDPAALPSALGQKMAIDATRKLGSE